MPAAIEEVFPGTIHRLCKWHILSKFSAQLNELYSTYSKRDFKGKFYSVINHPLIVHEFENAWKMLIVDEFSLGENATLRTLLPFDKSGCRLSSRQIIVALRFVRNEERV
jgi:hypothetical protein